MCAGVGVGSAATTATPADVGAESSGPFDMRVSNATDKAIDVAVWKTQGKNVVGELSARGLAAGERVYGRMDDKTVTNTTSIAVCYDHKYHSQTWKTTGHNWDDLYIFASPGDMFVTGTGGGDNRHLNYAGVSC